MYYNCCFFLEDTALMIADYVLGLFSEFYPIESYVHETLLIYPPGVLVFSCHRQQIEVAIA